MWGYFSDDDTGNCRSKEAKRGFIYENGATKKSHTPS